MRISLKKSDHSRLKMLVLLFGLACATSCNQQGNGRSGPVDEQASRFPFLLPSASNQTRGIKDLFASNEAQRVVKRINSRGGQVWFGEHPNLSSNDTSPPPPTFEQWKNVESSVTGIRMSPGKYGELADLKHFRSINELVLTGDSLSDEMLASLPKIESLGTLFIGNSKNFNGEGLIHVRRLTNLKTLEIFNAKGLRGESLVQIQGLSNLREVCHSKWFAYR